MNKIHMHPGKKKAAEQQGSSSTPTCLKNSVGIPSKERLFYDGRHADYQGGHGKSHPSCLTLGNHLIGN